VTDTVVAAGEPRYTTAQVAARLQLPVPTIRGASRSGPLRAYMPAGRRHGYRIAESAIQDFLRDNAAPQSKERSDAS
jgi:excisionase family DNA binding protein